MNCGVRGLGANETFALLPFHLASANQIKSDVIRKSFYDKYVQRQNTVKEFLKTVSDKKWVCDKKNFPSTFLCSFEKKLFDRSLKEESFN